MDVPTHLKAFYLEARLTKSLDIVKKLKNELANLETGTIRSNSGEVINMCFLCAGCGNSFKTVNSIKAHFCLAKLAKLELID